MDYTISPVDFVGKQTKADTPVPGKHPDLPYTVEEEIANCITHGLGALLAVAGMTALLVLSSLYGTWTHVVAFTIFGLCMVTVYMASTLYHSTFHLRIRRIFLILDHSAIKLMIAGSATPFFLLSSGSWYGLAIISLIWVLALSGIIRNVYSHISEKWAPVPPALYLALGWFGVLGIPDVYPNLPPMAFPFLVLGGLSYSAGVVFFVWEKLPYHHTYWHLFVLGGSVFHYIAMCQYLYQI